MVVARWLGEDKRVELRDDGGGGPGDQPADGVFVGALTGPRPSLLPLRLERAGGGPALWEGALRPAAALEQLYFEVRADHNGEHAVLLPAAPLGRSADARELAWTAAGFGWAALVLVYALGLALWRGR
ncbi:MAG: hypothetical protein JNM72_13140 [Deltaproteobacteria bacterium]|nr:hypothetical protein [Deltaproteobacteria bacterium]